MSTRAALAIVMWPALAVAVACGGSTHQQSTPATSAVTVANATTSSPSSSGPSISSAPGVAPSAWLTFGHDAGRSGLDPDQPSFRAASLRWSSPRLDGAVYGQPLVAGQLVVVATEGDTVYGLSAASGVVTWKAHLGNPLAGPDLACGNIDPSGITSTPVIDAGAGTVWVVAFVQPGHHDLVALDLATGAVKARRAIDAPGSDPRVEQQRGALSLAGGSVYVPYGGLFGDCGRYHGYVVSARTDGQGQLSSWQVPASGQGGLWSAGGAAVDPAGHLFVTSGNSSSSSTFDYGNTVVRLGSDLTLQDWFAPANSPSLNAQDQDLGSTSPALVGDQQQLVFQIGKAGDGYLLHADHLGQQGAPAATGHVCGSVFGATAYAKPLLYVPCDDGIRAVRIGPGDGFTVVWQGPRDHPGPPIVAGGAVWYLDTDSGDLVAIDATTGTKRFSAHAGAVSHFASPSAGDGQIIVAAGGRVQAYALA